MRVVRAGVVSVRDETNEDREKEEKVTRLRPHLSAVIRRLDSFFLSSWWSVMSLLSLSAPALDTFAPCP